jgi:hypothetical protein
MVKDIQKVQGALESQFISLQPIVGKTALELNQSDPELIISI